MRELLLIRHGQASFHADDYDRLSTVGEAQSRELGRWLTVSAQRPDLVAIGPRVRHRDTATLCLQAAGVKAEPLLLDGLDEVDHNELLARQRPDLAGPGEVRRAMKQEGDPKRAFQALFAASLQRWTGGGHDADYSLTWPAFRAQVLDALAQLQQQSAASIWAFTSGGPIAVIVGALMGVPIERTLELSWPLVNSGMTRLRLGARGATVVSYNSWPHLEREGRHDLISLR
jgi:broad specificity phosphatase PhoE